MIAKVEGTVEYVGMDEVDGKQYPFFQLIQFGVRGLEVIKVSGNGVKKGDKFAGSCLVSVNDKGRLKLKKLEV